ncbi:MAG: molybdopterin molybdotransferase MoeA, partial [Deltaproteobacteria bacterium]
EKSSGYILAEDVKADISSPPFDKSAMDGFAFIYSDNLQAGGRLRNIGEIQAGDKADYRPKEGECVRIMTGARMPEGTDTVIKVEETEEEGDYIVFKKVPKAKANVCKLGEDYKENELVKEKNTEIDYKVISVLAAIGASNVKVYRKPVVSIFSTGNEIVNHDEKPTGTQIRNSSAPFLIGKLNEMKIELRNYDIVEDEKELLKKAITDNFDNDLIIFTGGASVGDYDFTKEVLKDLDAKIYFTSTNIKPAQPATFSQLSDTYIFNLAGNPVSTMFLFEIYVKTLIKRLSNYQNVLPVFYKAELTTSVRRKNSRVNFVTSSVKYVDSQFYITPIKTNGPADILAYSKANAMLKIPTGVEELRKGAIAEFLFV